MNGQGWNSLMVALQINSLPILQIMIEGGLNEESRWKYGIKRWVADSWVALEGISKQGWNILHICSVYSDEPIIRYIISILIDRNKLYDSPDCPAIFLRHKITSINTMLESTCRKKNTPFLLAVKNNRLEAIKILVECNCSIYARNGKLQNAMHIAASKGYSKVIEYLISIDADKNILRSQLDIQKRKPKDLDVCNKLGNCFIHIWDYAKQGDFCKLEEVVDNKECSINSQTFFNKNTLLHVAVENRQLHMIRTLVKLGADKSIVNYLNKTPLDLAKDMLDPEYENQVFRLLDGRQSIVEKEYSNRRLNSTYKKLIKKDITHSSSAMKLPKVNPRALFPEKSNNELETSWDLIRKALIEKEMSIVNMYEMMDKNNDGALSFDEFQSLLIVLGIPISRDTCMKLFNSADENNNGQLEYSELLKKMHNSAVKSRNMRREATSMPKLLLNKSIS